MSGRTYVSPAGREIRRLFTFSSNLSPVVPLLAAPGSAGRSTTQGDADRYDDRPPGSERYSIAIIHHIYHRAHRDHRENEKEQTPQFPSVLCG